MKSDQSTSRAVSLPAFPALAVCHKWCVQVYGKISALSLIIYIKITVRTKSGHTFQNGNPGPPKDYACRAWNVCLTRNGVKMIRLPPCDVGIRRGLIKHDKKDMVLLWQGNWFYLIWFFGEWHCQSPGMSVRELKEGKVFDRSVWYSALEGSKRVNNKFVIRWTDYRQLQCILVALYHSSTENLRFIISEHLPPKI